MVYGLENTKHIENEFMKKYKGTSVSITRSNSTPGGFGDLFVTFSSKEDSEFKRDSGSFVLCSTPHNCGLAFLGGAYVNTRKIKCLKFEILEFICKYMGQSGILMSQTFSYGSYKLHDIYTKYGFRCIVQDRSVIHGNNKDLRIYYKPLNTERKKRIGGDSWEIPLGFISEEELKRYDDV